MPSFWDLLPAGTWPTGPFVLPGANENKAFGWAPYATEFQGAQQQGSGIDGLQFGQTALPNRMELNGKPESLTRQAQSFWDLVPANQWRDQSTALPQPSAPPVNQTLNGIYPWEVLPFVSNDADQVDRLATGRSARPVEDMVHGKNDDSWPTYRMRNLHRLMSVFGAPLPDYADERSKAISQGGGLVGGILHSAWDALTASGDAMHGDFDPMSQEGIERASNMAGWIVGGGIGAPRGTVGSGIRRPPGPPRFRPEPTEGQTQPFKSLGQLGNFADIDLDALSARAREIHGTLDSVAQDYRTTAVLMTDRGTIVAGSGDDLRGVQRAILRENEFPVYMKGADAEVTALRRALGVGFTPRAIAASRPFCEECIKEIESNGGRLLSPTVAIFPLLRLRT